MNRSVVLAIWLSLCLDAPATAPPHSAGKEPVGKLIEQLGSDRFEERERATRQLLDLDSIPAELHTAMKAQDLETRRRAARIIKGIEKRLAQVALAEVAALAKEGEIDQVIERVVRWAEEDPQAEGQKALNLLAKRLTKHRHLNKAPLMSILYLGELMLQTPPRNRGKEHGLWDVRGAPRPLVFKNDREKGDIFLRGAGVSVQGNAEGVITSTGPVKVVGGGSRNNCLIFSCGSVTVEKTAGDQFIILCDGDVHVRDGITHSVIVARGNVTLARIDNCVVYAGGSIKEEGLAYNGGSILRPKDNTGLGVIKFFDPAKAGIEVSPGMGGVTVQKTHKDKPFAAVVREKDVVTAINKVKVPSPEEFRRHLRAALAEGSKTITLTLNRSGITFDVHVAVRR